MEILHLEHFLALVDEGNFRRAAERVYRSQPALSQSIKKLEDEIGAPLFARDSHEVSVTEAGKLFAEYARRMLGLRDEATRRVSDLKELKTGALAIAAHESAAVYLLPDPLRKYLQLYPDIKVGIYRSRLEDIPRQVMDREVQVGFVKQRPVFHDLQWVEVHNDDMVLIASPKHPLASRREVRVRDLNDIPFVVHHMCSTTEKVVMRLFETYNARCRVVAELWSFENIKSFVQAGIGLAIVPRITVTRELRDKLLIGIPVKELRILRPTVMIFRPDYLSDSARELVNVMRNLDKLNSYQSDIKTPQNFAHV